MSLQRLTTLCYHGSIFYSAKQLAVMEEGARVFFLSHSSTFHPPLHYAPGAPEMCSQQRFRARAARGIHCQWELHDGRRPEPHAVALHLIHTRHLRRQTNKQTNTTTDGRLMERGCTNLAHSYNKLTRRKRGVRGGVAILQLTQPSASSEQGLKHLSETHRFDDSYDKRFCKSKQILAKNKGRFSEVQFSQ